MIIHGFGVTLIRLQHSDIELVRMHRNSSVINQYMEFREQISKEQQEKWFLSINNLHNNYFIIEYQGNKIGLIYGAGIDWQKKETQNGGIFIWEEKWLETQAPLAASLMLTEISFLLGLDRTYIKVLKENTRAVAFNYNLGYELLPDQDKVQNQKYVLTKESYYKKAGQFRAPYLKLHGDVFNISLDHPEEELEINFKAIYDSQPAEIEKRLQLSTC
ncbi:MAG: GNAT family N-acetyltransferase [Bacteroidetes bacterium]|nr:GNAT family N-acetyltransferase [Bacteroidota bacterium]